MALWKLLRSPGYATGHDTCSQSLLLRNSLTWAQSGKQNSPEHRRKLALSTSTGVLPSGLRQRSSHKGAANTAADASQVYAFLAGNLRTIVSQWEVLWGEALWATAEVCLLWVTVDPRQAPPHQAVLPQSYELTETQSVASLWRSQMVSQTSLSVEPRMPCLGLYAYLERIDAWIFPKSLLESILISGFLRCVWTQPVFRFWELRVCWEVVDLDETPTLTMHILWNGPQRLGCFVIPISADCHLDSKMPYVGIPVGFQPRVDSKG